MSYHLQPAHGQQPATTRDASQQLTGYITPSGGYLGAVNAASIFSSSWFPIAALIGGGLILGMVLQPRASRLRKRSRKYLGAPVTGSHTLLVAGGAALAGYLFGKGII